MKSASLLIFSLAALGLGILLGQGAPASAQIQQMQIGSGYRGAVRSGAPVSIATRPAAPITNPYYSVHVFPLQRLPVHGYSVPPSNLPYPFDPLLPYGPGNGAGPGYFAPPSISTYSGYDYSDYCSTDSGYDVYPTVYGDYEGLPNYFYEPGSIVLNAYSTVYCNGTFYPYGYDPFNTGTLGQLPTDSSTADSNTADNTASRDSDAAPASLPLASDLLKSLDLIASAWKTGNSAPLTQMVPKNGQVAVDLDGQYQYSIDPTAYNAMTQDAMKHVSTTDFRFTGVSMGANGAVTGYAIQSYKAPNGQPANVYLAYALRKNAAVPGGYALSGIGTSQRPVMISAKRSK